jgi:hypothetical protein
MWTKSTLIGTGVREYQISTAVMKKLKKETYQTDGMLLTSNLNHKNYMFVIYRWTFTRCFVLVCDMKGTT